MSTSGVTDTLAIEHEAERRVKAANDRVLAAESEAKSTLEHIQDRFERQYVDEGMRHQEVLEAQRMKGYEQFRDLLNQQQAELRRLRRTAETDLNRMNNHYASETRSTEQHGKQQIHDIQIENQKMLELQNRQAHESEKDAMDSFQDRQNQISRSTEEKIATLNSDSEKHIEMIRTQHEQNTQKLMDQLGQQYEENVKQSNDTLQNTNRLASQKLREIRNETAHKLSAYTSRQQDPFYKLLKLDAKLQDEGDFFTLTANIPEYEQKNVSASVRGDQLVITGQRRNQERLDLGGGHVQGSASFQSFEEAFPLSWPVEPSGLSRDTQGDTIVFRVPKKGQFALKLPKHAERTGMEKPNFPENLPDMPRTLSGAESNGSAESPLTRKGPGTTTMT